MIPLNFLPPPGWDASGTIPGKNRSYSTSFPPPDKLQANRNTNKHTQINRKNSVVVRNPYSGAMDDLGKLVKFEQCEKKGWLRPTMFRVVARNADGAETELYTTMQGVLPWNAQDQWHPSVMRSTWNQNSIDVFDALQLLCKENDGAYEPQQLDLTHLPIVRFTEGHPSPPRWKLPVYAASRRHVDKVETGYDESAWNKHPSAYGDHKRNVAYYPEFRGLSMENQLDTHLKNFAKHPYDSAGSRGHNAFGVSTMPAFHLGMQTNNEDVLRVVPAATAESYRIWATYENKPSSQKFNNSKDTSTGPWPFPQPIRDADPASAGPHAS